MVGIIGLALGCVNLLIGTGCLRYHCIARDTAHPKHSYAREVMAQFGGSEKLQLIGYAALSLATALILLGSAVYRTID